MTHSMKTFYMIGTYTSDDQEHEVFGWFEGPTGQGTILKSERICYVRRNQV
jgi:hypothetical protein